MRTIVAAILGTAVVFVWEGVAWVGLDLRGDRMKEQPTPDGLLPASRAWIDDSGSCVFPSLPDVPADADGSERTRQRKAWADAMVQGPVGVLLVRPKGGEPSGISMIVLGIAIVGFTVVAGVLVPGNFLLPPSDWVKTLAGDLAVGWSMAVLVVAVVVKSPSRSGRHVRT